MNYITEAFREMNEETFDVNPSGLSALQYFKDKSADMHDNVLSVIDPQADTEEDIAPSYVGKVICTCVICKQHVFVNPDCIKLVPDEDIVQVSCNSETDDEFECPNCSATSGFHIAGQVCEYNSNSEDEENEEEGEDKENEVKDVDDDAEEAEKEDSKESDDEDDDEDDEEESEPKDESLGTIAALAGGAIAGAGAGAVSAGIHNLLTDKFHNNEAELQEFLDERLGCDWCDCDCPDDGSGMITVTFNDGHCKKYMYADDELVDYDTNEICHRCCREECKESVNESVNATIETENGTVIADETGIHVDVPSQNAEAGEGATEVVGELSPEVQAEINGENAEGEEAEGEVASEGEGEEEIPAGETEPETAEGEKNEDEEEGEEVEESLTDIDESAFDRLGTQFLTTIYENVESYETVSGKQTADSLILEGYIHFKPKDELSEAVSKPTTFVFKPKDITPSGKARFEGYNPLVTSAKKAFILTGTMDNAKYIPESWSYNFAAKGVNGTSLTLNGTCH